MDTSPMTREEYFKVHGVVSHCFSPDGTHVAVSVRSLYRIDVYKIGDVTRVETWELVAQLRDAHQIVSGVDWSIRGALLMASHDRSVMVYQPTRAPAAYDAWRQELVIAQCQRGALNCQWNASGKKFSIGCGDHNVYIGYYETDMAWWNTLPIRANKSSVVATAFHPSGRVIAIGSTDFSLAIVTCAIVDDDDQFHPEHEDEAYSGPFSTVQTFGDILFQFKDTGGWVESLAFAPSATALVFAVHNGTLRSIVIDATNEQQRAFNLVEESLTVPSLPVRALLFKSDDELLAGGYDGRPFTLAFDAATGKLSFKGIVEKLLTDIKKDNTSKVKELGSSFLGQRQGAAAQRPAWPSTDAGTVFAGKPGHETAIACLRRYPSATGYYITTSDSTGRVLVWEA